MDLLLWRHAEAVDGFPDAARTLSPRGERQAERMAAWLDQHAPKDLRVVVSPATRTRQTVAPLQREHEISAQVGTDASAEDVLSAAGWPDANGAVLIVGHQPTLGQVAATLLGQPGADISFKKGALWWFRVRERFGVRETVLRAVIPAELV
ncbi:SixA phosphatase family protein [Niveibacterium umoris]|uniref:SixA phosphatase family protein n=1 Tax=Niveibacterium umoris TaxID=1193620 RepID=UPI00161B2B40|nr:histidine phosphatase family protein [Niveibacterium umoris]